MDEVDEEHKEEGHESLAQVVDDRRADGWVGGKDRQVGVLLRRAKQQRWVSVYSMLSKSAVFTEHASAKDPLSDGSKAS